MKCPHCGNENFKEPFYETVPVNGIDDPQYSGGLVKIRLAECKKCGELCQYQPENITTHAQDAKRGNRNEKEKRLSY